MKAVLLFVQSCGDADVLIVKQATDYARVCRDVVVMDEDTDIFGTDHESLESKHGRYGHHHRKEAKEEGI